MKIKILKKIKFVNIIFFSVLTVKNNNKNIRFRMSKYRSINIFNYLFVVVKKIKFDFR